MSLANTSRVLSLPGIQWHRGRCQAPLTPGLLVASEGAMTGTVAKTLSGITPQKGRRDPVPDLPHEEKEKYLRRIVELFGAKWLSAARSNPIATIWKRNDMLATIELLVLGWTLDKVHEQLTGKKRADFIERLQSPQRGTVHGAVLELHTAAILGQGAELSAVGAKGVDLSLIHGDRRVQVSCKALTPSAYNLEFEAAGREITKLVRKLLPREARIHLECVMAEDARLEEVLVVVREHLRPALKEWLRSGTQPISFGSCTMRLQELKPGNGLSWGTEPSFTVEFIAPLDTKEQLRFERKIGEALSDLGSHCSDVSSQKTNVVWMKLPRTVSVKSAVRFLQEWPDAEHVSAVFLYRSRVGWSQSRPKLHHEWVRVDNPTATAPLDEIAPVGTVPHFAIGSAETPSLDGGAREYRFTRGEHGYRAVVPFKVTLPSIPNINVSLTIAGLVGGETTIGEVSPPTDDLLIL